MQLAGCIKTSSCLIRRQIGTLQQMPRNCFSKQICCTYFFVEALLSAVVPSSLQAILHCLRAVGRPHRVEEPRTRRQKRRGAVAPRLTACSPMRAGKNLYIGFPVASGAAIPSAFFRVDRRRLRATFLTTRRTLRATFLTTRRRLRATRRTTRRTLRPVFLVARRRLRAVFRTTRRTLRPVFLTARRVLRAAFLAPFLAALLRVRFLAATMVYETSSP